MQWHDPISGVSVRWTPEFTAEFMAAQGECAHASQQRCVQIASNGSKRVRLQCLDCGMLVGNALPRPPDFDSLPGEDKELRVTYNRKVEERRSAIALKHADLQRRRDGEWWKRYDEYLKSDAWRARREKVLRRCSGTCEGCGDARAEEVHHLSYDHAFDEFLFELVALCRSCHVRIHAGEENEELPCSSCRMQSELYGTAWCGKFDVSSLNALEEGGPCGPTAVAREPLK